MSGFMGITALGPPNPFSVNLLSALGVTSFSDEEFFAVWKLVDKDQTGVRTDEVFEVLEGTYGFEPMPEEMNLFVVELALNESRTITWQEFTDALGRIREQVNKVGEAGRYYTSFQDISDDLVKGRRKPNGPMGIYKHPMTCMQEVGWHEEDVFNERFPKNSCNETRFQDAMYKSGWRG
jgi:hypothetical protein